MSDTKKNASNAKNKAMSEKEEVLENIMEELEQEAKDKEEAQKAEENAEAATEEAKEATEEKAAAEAESEAKEEPADDTKKKGLFTKKEKKNPLQDKVEELNDKVLRQMAEFDNYRKRTEKEKAQQFEMGQSSVLEKLLPIVDNFERGLAAVPEEDKDGAFADGMNKIYKQLTKQLEDLGVTPIEALGKEFDPNLHNAVMQVDTKDYESGVVAQELQKGYMFKDTVLRHSMVGVAQ